MECAFLVKCFLPFSSALELVGDRVVGICGRHVLGGFLAAFAEQKFFHLGDDHFLGFGVHGIKPVFIDQHGLVVNPLVPGLLRDVLENAFAELAGPGLEGQSGGVDLEFLTENGA